MSEIEEPEITEEEIELLAKHNQAEFLDKHYDRVKMWAKDHQGKKHKKLPIINTVTGFKWLNRAERRKLKHK